MERKVILNKPIKHIAFIMDGNGRWAKSRGLPRHLGHKEGCDRIIEVFEYCKEYDIKVMSFYAFSTENWNRPKSEISHLFTYLEIFFKKEIGKLMKDGVRVIISGDLTKLPLKTQKVCLNAIEKTKNNSNYYFNICLNYGGRDEIVRASLLLHQDLLENKINLSDVTTELFEKYLYTQGLPNVDLLVRTSGEQRTSNYLPWQLAYAEFVFTQVHWPDFKKDAFLDCLEEFNKRNRRFGGLKNE
ncbi:MAG: polyprenyl diphosphate synthase [Bacilli bacterium]|nr:polyprenyl diphosphate synthase [Bacilli bacterium]